ncbi:MAG: hypothetical protein AB8F74_19145 [Saprospiraceae bacterium]
MSGANAHHNTIIGNYVGLEPDGVTAAGHVNLGIILIGSGSNVIGGTTAAERNIIGSNYEGIDIYSDNNIVQGNYIGTDVSGTLDRGQVRGIDINTTASNNLIGGVTGGAPNLIVYNVNGISSSWDDTAINNSFLGNSIHSNTGMAIDLSGDANDPDVNDIDDTDSGSNDALNYPVITSAILDNGSIDVLFNLDINDATVVDGYRVEFFANPVVSASGYGEGQVYLGSVDLLGDVVDQSVSLPPVGGATTGWYLSATTTEINTGGASYGSTSEFSLSVEIYAPENCSNGIDDDGDGLVDGADPDCQDNDGDDIPDYVDLDDDNDGIPDLVECFPVDEGLNGFITPEGFDITGDAGNAPVILNSITINGNEYFDFIVPSSYSSDFSASEPISSGTIRAFENGSEIGDYVTSPDWPSAILPAFQSRNMNYYQYINHDLDNGVDYFQLGYSSPVYVNQNLFVAFSERQGNNSVILEALDVNGNPLGPQITISASDYVPTGVNIDPSPESLVFAILPLDDLASLGDLVYSIRVYDNNSSVFPDAADGKVFIFGDPLDSCTDTDGDGVDDYHDLDSDNDGIFDLDEAGHSAADANDDGIIDGAPSAFGTNGLFDGVETAPDSDVINYTISDSETAPDGTYDPYELDADGDGCFDTEEESVSDSDSDGLAGTGVPSVDLSGRVSGITYADPPNNTWQNPSDLGPCSFDICTSINPFENNTYNVWHTGGGGGLDFNQVQTSGPLAGYPSTFVQTGTTSNLPQREGGATFCHPATGEVLIYSDGEKAWDADGNEYATSDAQNRFNTLATNLSSSAGTPLIVARPGQCNYADELYIFFTDDHLGAAQELYYVVVDVPNRTISNPTQLSAGRTAEQTNAIQVSCDTTWIVYRNETDLYATLWTASGFSTPVVTNGIHTSADQRYRSAFSLDGTLYAATIGANPADTSIQKLVVASFNQATGRFTNPIYLQPFAALDPGRSPRTNYGVAFSPDNSKLYTTVSQVFPRVYYTVQFDLNAGNESQVQASMVELERTDTVMEMNGIVNGPDGRLYISGLGGTPSDSIHVIDFPNLAGTSANFRKNLLAPGGNVGHGLNNIVYGLGPSACIPSISNIQTGGDPCSSILLTIEECYSGSGGPYNVYFDLNGVPDSIVNQNLNGSNQISLTGLSTGIYTNIYITDNNGCASNPVDITLSGSSCPEVCDDGIDNDLDGYIDCFDPDCPCYAPFSCDVSSFLQTIRLTADVAGEGVSGDYILYRIDPATVNFIFVANLSDVGINPINSIAYNLQDGFIYGIRHNSAPYTLYRIDFNGNVEVLGNISGLAWQNEAGAMDASGNYYLTGSSQNLYRVDINTLSATLVGSLGFSMSDIAVNPVDGMLYGWSNTTNQLYQIDPSNANTTAIGAVNPDFNTMGAVYFNTQNELIAYGDDLRVTSSNQETLMKVDITTGVITPLGIGPSTSANDGCSCAYGVELTKAALDTICPGSTLTYTFEIFNRTGNVLNTIAFRDTLTNGLTWSSNVYNITGGLTFTGTSNGLSQANLTVNNIPVGSSTFQLDVDIPANYSSAIYSNKAYMSNFAAALPILRDTIGSDDPNTNAIQDITNTVIRQEIANNGIDDDCDGLVDCEDDDIYLASNSGGVDTDGDGIADLCDLDDDNDGIPDLDESGISTICPTIGGPEFPSFDYTNCSSISGGYLISNIGNFNGTSIDMTVTNLTGVTLDCGVANGCNGGDSGFSLLSTNNGEMATFSFFESGTSNPISINWSLFLDDFDAVEGIRVDSSNLFSYVLNSLNGTVVSEIGGQVDFQSNDNNEDDLQLFFVNVQTVDVNFSHTLGTRDVCFSSSSAYTPNNPSCSLYQIVGLDSDGDGVFNHLDLDSDNDGLYDVNEAGHGAADADEDGVIDGAASAFGTNGLFDALETVADNGVLNYTIADSETVPDGINDPYELDSDADGCFDAEEEGVLDGDDDGIAGTGVPAVDGNGLVTSITYTDPPNDQWQDPLTGACLTEICNDGIDNDGDGLIDCFDCEDCYAAAGCGDNDNDGIGDLCDLDDDNDGIPDEEEQCTVDLGVNPITVPEITGFPSSGGVPPGWTSSGDIGYGGITTGDGYINGSPRVTDLTVLPSCKSTDRIGYLDTGDGGAEWQTDLTGLAPNQNYTLSILWQQVTYTNTNGDAVTGESHLYVRANGVTTIYMNTGTVSTDTWEVAQIPVTTDGSGNAQIQISTFCASCSNYEGSAIAIITGDLLACCVRDTDTDGLPDYLDLDSDNDGLYDAVEAGHGQVHTNGVLTTAVGTNGLVDVLETSVDNGTLNYSIADSEISPDGTYDPYELDSDGDGCFDAEEENVIDGDSDGIAGTGTPTVDANGLVTSITYTDPPNDQWQDPLTGACLPEVCNDGIDNDGDGLIDCYDCEDCYAAAGCGDNDGDGVGDYCDLDDDNDGILDTDESCPLPYDSSYEHPDLGDFFEFNNVTPPIVNGTSTGAADPSALYSNAGSYLGQPFDVKVTFVGGPSNEDLNWQTSFLGVILTDGTNVSQFFDLTIEFFNAGTTTPFNITGGVLLGDIDANGVGRFLESELHSTFLSDPTFLTESSDGITREFSGSQNGDALPGLGVIAIYENKSLVHISIKKEFTSSGYAFHDFTTLLFPIPCFQDTDGDGIPDYLDLDSDNDGCPDAIEGDGSFTFLDLQNDTLTGGIDTNGIPTVASGGQGVGASQNAADSSACIEVCNDGIDNDGDGDIDINDSDCCGAKAPVLSKQ